MLEDNEKERFCELFDGSRAGLCCGVYIDTVPVNKPSGVFDSGHGSSLAKQPASLNTLQQ